MNFLDDALRVLPQPWRSLVIPLAVFLLVIGAGLVVRRIIFAKLRAWTKRSPTRVGGVLEESLHGPLFLWIVILAIYVATDISKLPHNMLDWAERVLQVLWVLSFTIVGARLAQRALRLVSVHNHRTIPMGSVVVNLAVGSLGVLFLLNIFQINLTPILTALGVGGLAVALALQDTLANVFAGFYVSLSGEIRIGDFVQVEGSHQGYVVDIGWRVTTMRERTNNMILIPNKKLAESIVTNYHLPEARLMLKVQVGVSMDVDPDVAEQAILDAYHAVSETNPGLLREPAGVALLLPGFGQSALEFTLICWVSDYEAQFGVQDQLRKRIWHIFRERGIGIPYPTRTIEYRQLPIPPGDGS